MTKLLLVITLSFVSLLRDCPGGGSPQTPVDKGNSEFQYYRLYPTSSSVAIEAEYDGTSILKPKNLFSSGESRRIYVTGNKPSSEYYAYVADYAGGFQYSVPIEHNNNSWFDATNNEYTAALWTTAPIGTGDYSIYIGLSPASIGGPFHYSRPLPIKVITARTFDIEYCSQTNYNLSSLGFVASSNEDYTKAFKNFWMQAGTEFTSSPGNVNITDLILTDITPSVLISYVEQYVSGGSSHSSSTVALFSLKGQNQTTLMGRTAIKATLVGSEYIYTAYPCIFIENIANQYSTFNESRLKIMRTRIALHELVHARAKDMYQGGQDLDPMTNGIYKDLCVWNEGYLPDDPLKAFLLCDGHRQLLLNINW